MKLNHCFTAITLLLQCGLTLAADERRTCFYLSKEKVQDDFLTVELLSSESAEEENSVRLTETGLLRGRERICHWSLNGGSGTKESFALDGGFAIPILDQACEAPFSHQYTGIGFGDWYLTLCGIKLDEEIQVEHDQSLLVTSAQALLQWTEYVPGKFPIAGDTPEEK